nr:alpha/beta fold hydrolase [Hyphomonas sp. Mor2]
MAQAEQNTQITPFSKLNLQASSDAWQRLGASMVALAMANANRAQSKQAPLPFDQAKLFRAASDVVRGAWSAPVNVMKFQAQAAKSWTEFSLDVTRQMFGGKSQLDLKPAKTDRRFRDSEWDENLYFKTIKDSYLLASQQMIELANEVLSLDEVARTRLDFLVRQYLNAVAPTNFAFSNPEVMRKSVEEGGANLIGGLANMISDLASDDAWIRREAEDHFILGEDIAATEGAVVYQNDIMQLIQYAPSTKQVYKRPLLYVPPLVNKYYLLDLKPASSLFKWLVDQGHTVFTISWVNPEKVHRDFDFGDYVVDGVVEALDVVREITGEPKTDLFSFCMGGAIAAGALGYLQAKGKSKHVSSATLMATLVDNSQLGEWGTFATKEQVEAFNHHVEHEGLISGSELKKLFSVVRANDLIWSSVLDHYLLDRKAPASDLLQWFNDGSNIPARFSRTWSRDVLADNKLAKAGGLKVRGVPIDLKKVKTPIFNLALHDDHVAGWQAVFETQNAFGGVVDFVLGGSGHNAGIVNPPSRNKHGYWLNSDKALTAEDWFVDAERFEGSWWPVWQEWLTSGKRAQEQTQARTPGNDKFKVIEAAPGSFVRR